MTFASLNLHPTLLSRVAALGYKTPTPIQKQSIPLILDGHDLLGLAQTGTGKTAAFVLPTLQRLMQGPRGRIRALIITPTRELAQQVHDSICELSKDSGLRCAALYGGININPQKIKLRRGVDIVIACPGRLLDHVNQRTIDLSKIEVLVLDEADLMFDMGFLPPTRKILALLPNKRQSLLFSATMPKDVRKLADEILHQPATVQIANTAPVKTVTQVLYPVSQPQKTDLLLKILLGADVKSTLIFTRTKQRAERLAEQLCEAGYSATSIQGNLSQYKRQKALNDFRKGTLQILVATDIASRGIDVAGISHVINYDMPDTVEAYTHRIGRTGRASQLGDAFTLVTREDSARVRALERVTGAKLEQRILPDFEYKTSKPTHAEKDKTTKGRRSFGKGKSASGYAKASTNGRSEGRPARAYGRSEDRSANANDRSEGRPARAHGRSEDRSANANDRSEGRPARAYSRSEDRSANANSRSDGRPARAYGRSEDRSANANSRSDGRPARAYGRSEDRSANANSRSDGRPARAYGRSEDRSANANSRSDGRPARAYGRSEDRSANANSRSDGRPARAYGRSEDRSANANSRSDGRPARAYGRSEDRSANANARSEGRPARAYSRSEDKSANANGRSEGRPARAYGRSEDRSADANGRSEGRPARAYGRSEDRSATVNSRSGSRTANTDSKANAKRGAKATRQQDSRPQARSRAGFSAARKNTKSKN